MSLFSSLFAFTLSLNPFWSLPLSFPCPYCLSSYFSLSHSLSLSTSFAFLPLSLSLFFAYFSLNHAFVFLQYFFTSYLSILLSLFFLGHTHTKASSPTFHHHHCFSALNCCSTTFFPYFHQNPSKTFFVEERI